MAVQGPRPAASLGEETGVLRSLAAANDRMLECGVAWRGMAWHGVAWRGMAWHGVANVFREARKYAVGLWLGNCNLII